MTDRYLVVDAPDPKAGLATAIQVVMDLYVRVQRDVVIVTRDVAATRDALADFVGPEAAEQLTETPQSFAEHTIRIVADPPNDLKDEHVVAYDADDPLLEVLDGQDQLTAVVAAPRSAEAVDAWKARHHPLEIAPRG